MIAVTLMVAWCCFVFIVMWYVGLWKVFSKAGRPGWGAIVPIYNAYLTIKVARKPGYWFFLLLVPFVNVVVCVMILHGISELFGHGAGFTVGLFVLGPVFVWILAFGSSTYSPLSGAPPVRAAAMARPSSPATKPSRPRASARPSG